MSYPQINLTCNLSFCLISVRDAAARLPNGEGTRSDICELLKDSQFLAPGVSDAQVINTILFNEYSNVFHC